MTLKLISFTVCPFVQRAVIVLNEQGRAHDVEYVDLANKPDWFLKLSPRGKVPVLVLDDGQVLFESQAIVEYLDETSVGEKLVPQDAAERARDRAWFATITEELLAPLYMMEVADDSSVLETNRVKLRQGLERMRDALGEQAYLSGRGTRFGLADVSAAPVFFRTAVLPDDEREGLLAGLPTVTAWMDRLLKREAVKTSVPASWVADHHAYGAKKGALLASR